jgi:hypothetical protein
MYCLLYAQNKTSVIANQQRGTELSPPAAGTKQILDTLLPKLNFDSSICDSRHGYKLIETEKEKD